MSDYPTNNNDAKFDTLLEERMEYNEFMNSEIRAYKKLTQLGSVTRNYVPVMVRDEIERRKAFLEDLLRGF